MAVVAPPLSTAWGYGIILGLGSLFALGMIFVTWTLKRYNNELQTSEVFTTAGRTVKTGLVASAVVSSWTWAASLLQSSAVTYRYGVSGPFWYASGATVQIILFATIAIEMKRRAPNAHTFLELIKVRYGIAAHLVFTTFGVMTNILVTAMLLTGGSSAFTALTGIPTAAACFLLPLGVVIYTAFGGIKATFLTDYVHTAILLLIIIILTLTTYGTSQLLGSPRAVYDLLVQKAIDFPVDGNSGGSYLTMRSSQGVIFFIINIVGNFGTVFCDNGYYNKAIAASPVHALPGYVLGGLSWFAIPFTLATTMGLAALALEGHPAFPTYPDRMTEAQVDSALVLPFAAVALLGSGGAVCALLIVFMAVTSALSAELIAVSSIFTYDIYQTYINPAASGRKLIYMGHCMVGGFGLAIAAFATGLHYAGISMGFLYLFMGVVVSSAVLPACLTLLWAGQNKYAATWSPPVGLALSFIAWLVTAKKLSGELTVVTLGANYPMLAGNLCALISPFIIIAVLTLVFGVDHYTWDTMKAIQKADDNDLIDAAQMDPELVVGQTEQTEAELQVEQAKLLKNSKIAKWLTVVMTLSLLVLWPFPMFGSKYVFSRRFFEGWVVVGIIWVFFAFICVGIYPVVEGRRSIWRVVKAMFGDMTGKRQNENKYIEGSEVREMKSEAVVETTTVGEDPKHAKL